MKQLQIFQMSFGSEISVEEDDKDYHGHPKPHYRLSVCKTKSAGNRIPNSGGGKYSSINISIIQKGLI